MQLATGDNFPELSLIPHPVSGLGLVQGTGYRVQGIGLSIEGLGYRVQGIGLSLEGLGLRGQGWFGLMVLGFVVQRFRVFAPLRVIRLGMVKGLGFRVQGSGFRVQGLGDFIEVGGKKVNKNLANEETLDSYVQSNPKEFRVQGLEFRIQVQSSECVSSSSQIG